MTKPRWQRQPDGRERLALESNVVAVAWRETRAGWGRIPPYVFRVSRGERVVDAGRSGSMESAKRRARAAAERAERGGGA